MGDLSGDKGFTLIECAVAMAILAILVSLAIPSYHHIKLRAQQYSALHQLKAAVMLARHIAIFDATNMLLCPSPSTSTQSFNAPLVAAKCGTNYSTGVGVWFLEPSGWLPYQFWQWDEVRMTNRRGSRAANEHIVFGEDGLANRNMTWSSCVGDANLSLVLNGIGRPVMRSQWGAC